MADLHVLKMREMDCASEYNSYSELKTARGLRLSSKAYGGRTFKIILQNTTKFFLTNYVYMRETKG